MRIARYQLFLCLILWTAFGCQRLTAAQPVANLQYFQRLAEDRNPTIRVVRHQITAAKGEKVQAGLYPNPVVGYHANEIGMQGSDGAHGVFVRQRIPAGMKRHLEIDIAQSQLTQFQFQLSLVQKRVKTDVAIAFGRLLIAQKRLEILQRLRRSWHDVMQRTEALVKSGRAGLHSLLQSQIEYEQADLQMVQAQQEIKTAWMILQSICGIEGEEIVKVSGELYKIVNPVSWDFIVASVIQQNPQVALLRYQIEEQRLRLRRHEVDNIPDVEFMLSFRQHSLTGEDIANVQIGMPIPVFDDNRGNITAAQARLKVLDNELSILKLKLRVRAGEVFRDYENARIAEQRYREVIIPAAEKNESVVQAGFENQQFDYFAILTAQRTLLRVNLSYLDASEKLFEAVSELNGQLLKEHLIR